MTDYNQPTEGASDWHLPLNENFSDLGIEVAEEVPTWGDLPAPADVEQSTNGQWPVYRVEADDVFVRIDDTTKRIIGGTGSADHPLPETHHKALNTVRSTADRHDPGGGQILGDRGYTDRPLSGTTATRPTTQPVMTIGYDDQSAHVYDYAFPVHQDEGVPGTFYVVPKRIDDGGDYTYGPADAWGRLREMDQTEPGNGGIDIQDHSYDHNNQANLSRGDRLANAIKSKTRFHEENITVRHHAYPGGSHDPEVRTDFQRFFDTGRWNQGTHNAGTENPYSVRTDAIDSKSVANVKSEIDTAAANDSWYDAFMHAVHPDGSVNGNTVKTPSELQEIIQYAVNNGVSVVTFDEAVETFMPATFYQGRDGRRTSVTRRDGHVEPGFVAPNEAGRFPQWRAANHAHTASYTFDSLDGVNSRANGSGGHTMTPQGQLELSTGTTSGSESVMMVGQGTIGAYDASGDYRGVKIVATPEGGSTFRLVAGGLYEDGTGAGVAREHVGVYYDGADMYITTGDGTDEYTTLIASNVDWGVRPISVHIEEMQEQKAKVRVYSYSSRTVIAEGETTSNLPASGSGGVLAARVDNPGESINYTLSMRSAEGVLMHRDQWNERYRSGRTSESDPWF